MLRLYLTFVNSKKHNMEIMFEIWVMPGKQQFAVLRKSHISDAIIYNQATTKLVIHSNETSKDKLSII